MSLHIKCFKELVQYGAQAVLEREYGPYIVEPESGYDFSVLVDLENLPEDQGAIDPAWAKRSADGMQRPRMIWFAA